MSELTLNQATKKIVPLALTMAGTQFLNVASGFLCMIMLAHLGHQVLAASALMISTQITIMVIGMSILFSLSLLCILQMHFFCMSGYDFTIRSESARRIVKASSKLPIAEMKNPILLTSSMMSGLFCI